ncbi:MAG: homocysteine S-methyltransferase family protein [Candidatus Eisenbacteria bacterium]
MQALQFREILKQRILVMDSPWGAIMGGRSGTGAGPGAEPIPELLALEDFSALVALHAASIEAGADVLVTNTMAANAPALSPFGYAERAVEIVRRSVEAARQAAGEAQGRPDGTPLVATALGPLPPGIAPAGALGMEEAIAAYREVIAAARSAGFDLLLLEAISDVRTLKAALIALREERNDLAVIALMAFGMGGRAADDATPAVAWAVARSLGADVVGATGDLSPAAMLPIQAALHAVGDLPLALMPAVGARQIAPLEFARQFQSLFERGVALVGCGGLREHEHVRRLAKAARRHTPRLPDPAQRLVVTSASRDIEIGPRRSIVCAAEWPARRGETFLAHRGSGNEQLLSTLEESAGTEVRMLEIRSTLPHIEEASFFAGLLPALREKIDLPLMISAETPKGLRAALEMLPGRPLVAGVWGEERSFAEVFPLVRRYGAAVVAACHSGTRIPETAEERLEIAEKILAAAIEAGVRQEDVIFDPVLPPTRSPAGPMREVLRALTLIRERLGQPTMLRISRISEDFPARGQLEASFLCMAAAAGLDLALIDSAKPRLVHLAMAASLLLGRDPEGRRFKARFRLVEGEERSENRRFDARTETERGETAPGRVRAEARPERMRGEAARRPEGAAHGGRQRLEPHQLRRSQREDRRPQDEPQRPSRAFPRASRSPRFAESEDRGGWRPPRPRSARPEDRERRGPPRPRSARPEDRERRGPPRPRSARPEDRERRGPPRPRSARPEDHERRGASGPRGRRPEDPPGRESSHPRGRPHDDRGRRESSGARRARPDDRGGRETSWPRGKPPEERQRREAFRPRGARPPGRPARGGAGSSGEGDRDRRSRRKE